MSVSPEIQNRRDELLKELDEGIRHAAVRAKVNYWIAICLMLGALVSSAGAGIGGILLGWSAKLTGGLALLPGILALFATTLRFEGKSNWQYRKMYALAALKSRLRLQLPETPSADNIASIAKDRDELTVRMQKEWDKEFALSWSAFQRGHRDP